MEVTRSGRRQTGSRLRLRNQRRATRGRNGARRQATRRLIREINALRQDTNSHTDYDMDTHTDSDTGRPQVPQQPQQHQQPLQPQQPQIAIDMKTTKSPSQCQEKSVKFKGIGCNVCLEDINEIQQNDRRLVTTPCGHLLCNECAEKVTQTIKKCPVCQKKLRKRNPFIQIFV